MVLPLSLELDDALAARHCWPSLTLLELRRCGNGAWTIRVTAKAVSEPNCFNERRMHRRGQSPRGAGPFKHSGGLTNAPTIVDSPPPSFLSRLRRRGASINYRGDRPDAATQCAEPVPAGQGVPEGPGDVCRGRHSPRRSKSRLADRGCTPNAWGTS